MGVALQMSTERWGIRDSLGQAWDAFQVLNKQLYKHPLWYLEGYLGAKPGFSTLWWESHYHFTSLLCASNPCPNAALWPGKPSPPLLPTFLKSNDREPAKNFLRESGNWYMLWEPFFFSSPSPGCKTMAWGFPLRANWDLGRGGEGGTAVSLALPWQRRFLMKWLRSIRAAGEKQLPRGFALVQFCFQKRLL